MQAFISNYGSIIALLLRMFSCVQILVFVIPLQIKEYNVRNGLIRLRQQLLAFGIILFLVNVITTLFLASILIKNQGQPVINASLQLFNAAAFIAMSTLGTMMYHSQYSEESKDFHAQVESEVNKK